MSAYYVLGPCEAFSNLARFDSVRYGYCDPGHADLGSQYEASRAKGFGPETRRRIMLGRRDPLSAGVYDTYYYPAQQVRTLITQDYERAFQQVDCILAPVSPRTAFRFGEVSDPTDMYLSDMFTISINIAGNGGMSLPAGPGRRHGPARRRAAGLATVQGREHAACGRCAGNGVRPGSRGARLPRGRERSRPPREHSGRRRCGSGESICPASFRQRGRPRRCPPSEFRTSRTARRAVRASQDCLSGRALPRAPQRRSKGRVSNMRKLEEVLQDWEAVIGLEVHAELHHARDEDVLRLQAGVRRRAQHAHVSRVPGPAGRAARAEQGRHRVHRAGRPGHELRHREALDVLPQELHVPRHVEELPDHAGPCGLLHAGASGLGRGRPGRQGAHHGRGPRRGRL